MEEESLYILRKSNCISRMGCNQGPLSAARYQRPCADPSTPHPFACLAQQTSPGLTQHPDTTVLIRQQSLIILHQHKGLRNLLIPNAKAFSSSIRGLQLLSVLIALDSFPESRYRSVYSFRGKEHPCRRKCFVIDVLNQIISTDVLFVLPAQKQLFDSCARKSGISTCQGLDPTASLRRTSKRQVPVRTHVLVPEIWRVKSAAGYVCSKRTLEQNVHWFCSTELTTKFSNGTIYCQNISDFALANGGWQRALSKRWWWYIVLSQSVGFNSGTNAGCWMHTYKLFFKNQNLQTEKSR